MECVPCLPCIAKPQSGETMVHLILTLGFIIMMSNGKVNAADCVFGLILLKYVLTRLGRVEERYICKGHFFCCLYEKPATWGRR